MVLWARRGLRLQPNAHCAAQPNARYPTPCPCTGRLCRALVMADSSPGGAARAMRRVAAEVAIVADVVAITMIVADGQPAQVRKRMACIVPRDRGVARHAAWKIHTAYLETRGWRGGSAARRDCRTALDDRPPSKPLALRLTAGHRHQPCSLLLAHAYAVSLCVLAPCTICCPGALRSDSVNDQGRRRQDV